jgi:tetratricopeptide (TPR) repeat protein
MLQLVKNELSKMDLNLKSSPTSRLAWWALAFAAFVIWCGAAMAQDADAPGMEELNQAFDKKINSTTTRDLDEVAKLCEQAIKKGLEGDAAEQARMLAKTAYYEHADQLANRIFSMTSETDPRWQRMRREALRRLEKTVKLDPEMASAYVLIARLNSLPRGDVKEGKEAAETAIDLIEDDDELLAQALMAKVALKLSGVKKVEGVVDEIMDDIDRAIELDPRNEQARFLRSKLLARSGKIAEGLEDLDAALEAVDSSDAYKLEAQRLITNPKFGDTPEMQAAALRYLDKAMGLEEDPNLLLTKAIVYQVMKNPQAALKSVDQHLDAKPENVRAYMLRSALNAEQKKLEDAIADLDKAAEIKPDEIAIYTNRIELHQLNDDTDAAIRDCKIILDKKPGEYSFQVRLAVLYMTAERPLAATEVLSDVLDELQDGAWEDDPGIVGLQLAMRRSDALRLRGGAYLNAGEHEKSIEDYELAVDMVDVINDLQQQISPRMRARLKIDSFEPNPGLLNNLAWVLATSPMDELRDGDRAIELAEKAAELTDYQEAYILSTLASAYAEVGDFEKAVQWSEKAVERNREEVEEIRSDQELDDSVKEEQLINSEEQLESLQKELASYQDEKPWRELQTSSEAIEQDSAAGEDESEEEEMEEEEAEEEEAEEEEAEEEEMKNSEDEPVEGDESENEDSDSDSDEDSDEDSD